MTGEKEIAIENRPIRKMRRVGRLGKRSFYLWIAYQAIKGTLTTIFIWAPLIWHFMR